MKKISHNQKIIIPLIALLILGTGISSVSAISVRSGEKLTPEQRQILEEVRELMKAGEKEAAQELLEEAGIERPERAPRADKEAVHAALEANDYDAFVAATANGPFAEDINEEIFETLVEAHELRQDGDKEGAKELLEDAGIERPRRGGEGRHQGHFNNLSEEQQEIVRSLGNDREAIKAYLEEEGVERGR